MRIGGSRQGSGKTSALFLSNPVEYLFDCEILIEKEVLEGVDPGGDRPAGDFCSPASMGSSHKLLAVDMVSSLNALTTGAISSVT